MLWKGDSSVCIEGNDFQFVNMKVKLSSLDYWVQFTAVNGSPSLSSRKELWPTLGNIA